MNDDNSAFVRDGELAVRLMRDEDADYQLMARWLADDDVLMYFEGRDNAFSLERVIEDYRPLVLGEDEDDPVVPCIVEYEGQPLGFLQYYPVAPFEREFGLEPGDGAEGAYALDLFIAEPGMRDRGIGTRLVKAMLRFFSTSYRHRGRLLTRSRGTSAPCTSTRRPASVCCA